MTEWAAKRFWTGAEVAPAEAGGFTVTLDGRAVKTPAKAPLVLPTRALAEAVAAEWQAQGEKIDPGTMPVTRAANSAIDKVTPQHAEVVEMLAAYGGTDLLCYRAEAPEALAARQAQAWDPLLDWAAETYDARLNVGAGVMHIPQPADALRKLRAPVAAMTPFELAGFHDLVALSGSLVIALATVAGVAPPEELWAASRIDETWQEEQWGTDAEAAEQAETKRRAFLAAQRFYALCAPGAA